MDFFDPQLRNFTFEKTQKTITNYKTICLFFLTSVPVQKSYGSERETKKEKISLTMISEFKVMIKCFSVCATGVTEFF